MLEPPERVGIFRVDKQYVQGLAPFFVKNRFIGIIQFHLTAFPSKAETSAFIGEWFTGKSSFGTFALFPTWDKLGTVTHFLSLFPALTGLPAFPLTHLNGNRSSRFLTNPSSAKGRLTIELRRTE